MIFLRHQCTEAEIKAMTQTYLMVEVVSRERERAAREERRLRDVVDIYTRRASNNHT